MFKLLLILTSLAFIQSCAVKNPVTSQKSTSAKRSIASIDESDSENQSENQVEETQTENDSEAESATVAKPKLAATSAEMRMKEEIVSEHAEMFENESVKSKLKQMIKKISSIRNKLIDRGGKAIEHKGVGVSAAAFAGVGLSKTIEFFVHNQKIGLFCAPAVSVRTDVGIEVDLLVGQSMSCNSNNQYSGGAIGVFGGISAETLGLPAGVGAGYNVGINYPQFKKALDNAIHVKKLSAMGLAGELQRLGHIENTNLLLLAHLSRRLVSRRKDEDHSITETLANVAERTLQGKSLSKQLLEYISSPGFEEFIAKNKLYHLGIIADVLEKSITGCDSVGGSLALELSASPVTVGVQYADIHLLTEIEIEDIKELTLLNTDILDNPFSYSVDQLRRATVLAGKIISIPFALNSDECSLAQFLRLQ